MEVFKGWPYAIEIFCLAIEPATMWIRWALLLFFVCKGAKGLPDVINLRPIIGILTQEYFDSKSSTFPNGSQIAASYVKMVESSGARVVPVFIGGDLAYYTNIVNTVNGILLPGGGVDLWAKGGYGEAAEMIYKLVLDVNANGTYFPLYGVCLGWEILAVASAGMSRDVLVDVQGVNKIALPLNFTHDFQSSALFSHTPQQIINYLRTAVTANHHSKCLTEESLKSHNLIETWRVLSTSTKEGGLNFVSTTEHKVYPQIFATQFHPEKVPFEWAKGSNDPHDWNAIIANRWFYDYFVDLARRNGNKFASNKEESNALIYNYQATYTGTYFEQIYIFRNVTSQPTSAG